MNRTPTTLPTRLDTVSPQLIDTLAQDYGKRLADQKRGIKTHQVRNVFAHVNSMRVRLQRDRTWTDDLERTLILLKPKLAYAAGRQHNVKPFQELLSQAIDGVVASNDKVRAVQNFFDLVESIVAYHKYHGGN